MLGGQERSDRKLRDRKALTPSRSEGRAVCQKPTIARKRPVWAILPG